MIFRKKKDKRYRAVKLNWKPILGVETGTVKDTRPDEPSKVDKTGPGWEFVTTYSNAKWIARWANWTDR